MTYSALLSLNHVIPRKRCKNAIVRKKSLNCEIKSSNYHFYFYFVMETSFLTGIKGTLFYKALYSKISKVHFRHSPNFG